MIYSRSLAQAVANAGLICCMNFITVFFNENILKEKKYRTTNVVLYGSKKKIYDADAST